MDLKKTSCHLILSFPVFVDTSDEIFFSEH